MTEDPLMGSADPGNPQTWNRYAYVINNPLHYTDPFGLFMWDESAGGFEADDTKITSDQRRFREGFRRILGSSSWLRSIYGGEWEYNGIYIGINTGIVATVSPDIIINPLIGNEYMFDTTVLLRPDKLEEDANHEAKHLDDYKRLIPILNAHLNNPSLDFSFIFSCFANVTRTAIEERAYNVSLPIARRIWRNKNNRQEMPDYRVNGIVVWDPDLQRNTGQPIGGTNTIDRAKLRIALGPYANDKVFIHIIPSK